LFFWSFDDLSSKTFGILFNGSPSSLAVPVPVGISVDDSINQRRSPIVAAQGATATATTRRTIDDDKRQFAITPPSPSPSS
jgi:hypothetical protein